MIFMIHRCWSHLFNITSAQRSDGRHISPNYGHIRSNTQVKKSLYRAEWHEIIETLKECVHLISMPLPNVHLRSTHPIGAHHGDMHLMSMYRRGMHLMSVYLT